MATNRQKVTLGIGAGLAAAAAGAALGYYFYGSDDAPQHRKKAAAWAGNLKNDVLKEAKKLGNLNRKTLLSIIDEVSGAYQKIRSLDKDELRAAVQELKENWDRLREEVYEKGTSSGARQKAGSSSRTRTNSKGRNPAATTRNPRAQSRLRRASAKARTRQSKTSDSPGTASQS